MRPFIRSFTVLQSPSHPRDIPSTLAKGQQATDDIAPMFFNDFLGGLVHWRIVRVTYSRNPSSRNEDLECLDEFVRCHVGDQLEMHGAGNSARKYYEQRGNFVR